MSGGNDHRFYCACLQSCIDIANKALAENPNDVTVQKIASFLVEWASLHLYSLGRGMDKVGKSNEKAIKRCRQEIKTILTNPMFKGCRIVLDNAGFQIAQGMVALDKLMGFIEEYYDLLYEVLPKLDRAFVLDLASSKEACVFQSIDEMRSLNEKSCARAAAMPDALWKKLIFIMHFRGPQTYRLGRDLLDEYGGSFTHFATGGLAVDPKVAGGLPVMPYAIPLTDIVVHAKERVLDTLQFHVLGSSKWHEILAHVMIEEHLRAVHGIDVEITYDSSSIFQGFVRGRYFWFPDHVDRTIVKKNLASPYLGICDTPGRSRADWLCEVANDALVPYGMGPFNSKQHPLYQGNRTTSIGHFQGVMATLALFNTVGAWCRETAAKAYAHYDAGERSEAGQTLVNQLVRFEPGPERHAHAVATAKSILCTLDMLTQLDLGYTRRLVDRHLVGDEHPKLRVRPSLVRLSRAVGAPHVA